MRAFRYWWRRMRGWWLVAVAAVATAALSAVSQRLSGFVASLVVAVVGGVAAIFGERGRAQLLGGQAGEPSVWLRRVDQADDPIMLGVHPASAERHADGTVDRIPLFVERDRAAALR